MTLTPAAQRVLLKALTEPDTLSAYDMQVLNALAGRLRTELEPRRKIAPPAESLH